MRLSPGRRAVRTALVLPAVVALTVTGAGCSTTVSGTAVIAEPKVGQPVTWGPCRTGGRRRGNALPIPAGAQCGQIGVPVDYAKPDGDVATLALIRFPATGEKIGSLILNPGGPGSPASRPPPASSGTCPPRSASGSTWSASTRAGWVPPPGGVVQLRCGQRPDPGRPAGRLQPAGVEHIEGQTKAFIQRCIDKMGKDFLKNVGTSNVAKDLDALRAAVGDDKLTYLGYSYGTRIGAAYAEAYPDKVRGMILDGAVDPNADPIKADLAQAAAFQQAFNDYAADCAEDPTCPLGTDPAKAVEAYRDLVDPLVDQPMRTADPRGLGYSDAIVGTIMALYSPNLWRHLTQALTEMTEGHGDTMLALADMYMRRDPQGTTPTPPTPGSRSTAWTSRPSPTGTR